MDIVVVAHHRTQPNGPLNLVLLQPSHSMFGMMAKVWYKVTEICRRGRGLRASIFLSQLYPGHYDARVTEFLGYLGQKSPLLVLAMDLPARVMAEHPRGSWDDDFDIRRQAIKFREDRVSFTTVKYAMAMQAQELFMQRPTDQAARDARVRATDEYCVSVVLLLVAGVHEVGGHMAITYYGKGRVLTPPHMRSSSSRLDQGEGGDSDGEDDDEDDDDDDNDDDDDADEDEDENRGESGEIFEQRVFGGLVDFFRDSAYPSLPASHPCAPLPDVPY
ncbi:hypothetical protein LTR86_010995 [Recurvomyces mirabilis]|nr:hypothetical protein LTR86_010995 [Recurvomyces mirabilis]